MHLPEIDWPPKRFEEAFKICKDCNLIDEVKDLKLLENLDKKTRRLACGKEDAQLTIRAYLVSLGTVLGDLLENESKYKKLRQKRGTRALWDATYAVYLLMLYMDIIPQPLT